MSRHVFQTKKNGEDVLVTMGWDRPMQGYFMVIFDKDEDVIYSNLDHEVPHPPTPDRFICYLNDNKITIPDQMLEKLFEDGARNAGNEFCDWNKILKEGQDKND